MVANLLGAGHLRELTRAPLNWYKTSHDLHRSATDRSKRTVAAGAKLTLGTIPSREFQRDVERDRRRECWNLDVQRRVRLADDKPRSGSADRVIRSSGNDSAIFLLALPAGALADVIDRRR